MTISDHSRHFLKDASLLAWECSIAFDELMHIVGCEIVVAALQKFHGNQCAAARSLGMHRNTLGKMGQSGKRSGHEGAEVDGTTAEEVGRISRCQGGEMSAADVQKLLAKLHACEEAREWAKGKSLAEIWQSCERGDWLLWLCARMAGEKGWPTKQEVVLAACACARTALRFVPDGEKRPLLAIETAERWAKGEATLREMRTYAAASAADAAASDAAYYAAASAADAAASAADAAASAAASAADAAADANALKECAEIVRQKLHFVAIEDAAVENQRDGR